MILRPSGRARQGMTLLEVMLALAIFLFALAAISQLFNVATDQAKDVALTSRATRLAQSKMAEYAAGVRGLDSGGQGDFEEEAEPGWDWQSEIQADNTAAGLYLVSVTVNRTLPGPQVSTTLTQYVFNPKLKGNIPAPTPLSTSGSTTPTDTSSSTTTGSTTSTNTTSSGGGSTGGASTSGSSSSGAGTKGK